MTDRELMQQALEALEQSETTVPYEGFGMAHREAERKHQASITALRERLAQVEQPSDLDWWKARAIQAERLVEKFGQPEQELVVKWDASAPLVVHPHPAFQAAPPQRKPLTDERIGQIIEGCKITLVNYCSDDKQIEFARAIEAAHGIKE